VRGTVAAVGLGGFIGAGRGSCVAGGGGGGAGGRPFRGGRGARRPPGEGVKNEDAGDHERERGQIQKTIGRGD
jgi:hypothetical protein